MKKRYIKFIINLVFSVCLLIFGGMKLNAYAASCPDCGGTLTKNIYDDLKCYPGFAGEAHYNYMCPNCGYMDYGSAGVDTPNHQGYSQTGYKAADCTSAGYTESTCAGCGDKITSAISPLGHNYKTVVTKEATCESEGSKTLTCSRCGESRTEVIKSLGHKYSEAKIDATCEKDGHSDFICLRCQDTYSEYYDALGHNYNLISEKDATCTESGEKKYECTECGDIYVKTIPATGHTLSSEVVSVVSCSEKGETKYTCSECDYSYSDIVSSTGHKWPDEWTIETEATTKTEGYEYKLCLLCGAKAEKFVPKTTSATPIITVASGTIIAVVGAFITISKKKAAEKAVETVTKAATTNISTAVAGVATVSGAAKLSIPKPELTDKIVMLCLDESEEDNKLEKLFRSKHYLEVAMSDRESLGENCADREPDLIVVKIADKDDLDTIPDLVSSVKEEYEDAEFTLLIPKESAAELKEKLDELKENEIISAYVPEMKSESITLINIILPMYKPDLTGDDSIEYIGVLGDVFGFPAVSTLTNLYLSGKDLKENMEEDEKGVSEIAAIIGDIASVLGFETVESIASLVDSADSIKAVFDKESGVHELKEGKSAVEDIIETVTDLV